MRIAPLLVAFLGIGMNLCAEGCADTLANSLADTGRFNALMHRAFPFFQTNLDSANFYYQRARELAVADHDRREYAEATDELGNYYRQKGDYTGAMPYYEQARAIFDSLKDWSGAGLTAMNTAQLYKDISSMNRTMTLIDQGIQMAVNSYELFLRARDTTWMINALNEEGILYRDKAKNKGFEHYYDTAYARYLFALELIQMSGKAKKLVPRFYNNISQIFREYKKDPRSALIYLQRAEALNLAANNRFSLTFNYNNFSLAYIDLGKVDSSIYYARKMLSLATELKMPSRRYDAYHQLYLSFEAAKRFDSSLFYYRIATELNDSLTNLAKTKEVLNLQEQYNSVKKEMDITKLNAENSAKNKAITFLIVVLAFLAVLVAGFSYLIARLRSQKKQIAEQSVKLEVMLRELHHRVKNNLQIVSSLLGLQRYKSEDAATISVLQESQHRVQAMSLIHQRLYRNDALSTVNIRDYLIDLCESLLSSYGYDRDRFDLNICVSTDVLDIDHALPIGLIVNELVTNAFKYAYPGVGRPALRISLEQDNRHMVLVVSDNGVGIDEERWRQGKDSFGKQLIGALCKQLRATQEMAAAEGTVITIKIPKEAA